MKHASDDCPHPDFEPGPVLLYVRNLWRCTSCRSVWHASTGPVQRWMAATGRGVEPEPFA